MGIEADYQTFQAEIPEHRIREVLDKLLRLSKTAEKLGLPAFDISTSEPVLRKVYSKTEAFVVENTLTHMRWVPITVTGGPPKLNGWRFLAKIEHDEGGNDVKGAAAQAAVDRDPEFFKTLTLCPPNCDHCNLKRKRNVTYFFEKPGVSDSDTPERIQVGNSCVADFSGHKDPEMILHMASVYIEVINEISDPDEMSMGGGSGIAVFQAHDVLSLAAGLIRNEGRWVSRAAAEARLETSSADLLAMAATNPKARRGLVNDDDKAKASKVEQWLVSDDFDPGTNLYLHNLRKMALRGYAKFNELGFLGSAVATWGREQEKRVNLERQQNESVKLGEEGEQLKLTVNLEKVIPIETMMGLSRLHIMRDLDTGSKVTWFSSGSRKFYVGDDYEIKGRVKGYREWNGVWETQLSRVNSPDLALHNKIDDSMDEAKMIKKIKKLERIDARDSDGETLLHLCSHLYRFRETARDVIVALLEQGANPTFRSDRDEKTAVDYWIEANDHELIRVAIEQFPESLVQWTDTELKDFEVFDQPWVAELQVARDQAKAKIDAENRALAEKVEAEKASDRVAQGNFNKAGDTQTKQGEVDLLNTDDDLDDDESLKLA